MFIRISRQLVTSPAAAAREGHPESSCPMARAKNMLCPMSATTANVSAPTRPRWNLARRLASIVLLAFIIGCMLNRAAQQLERNHRPAGFIRGLVQGALMPASMPNLLIGHDVAIYAVNNNGVFYKLGYTMGVNACGAIFFGLFSWRLKRWRNRP